MVTEHRVLDGGERKGHIVIRVGTVVSVFYMMVFSHSYQGGY